MPSTKSDATAYQWTPKVLWEMVELRAAEATESFPAEAKRLMAEFVDPAAADPLDDLLRGLKRQESDPAKAYLRYQEKGGPDPRKVPPLQVLEGLTKLFEMWYPKGGEEDFAPQDR